MKWYLTLLLAVTALTSCSTTHDAAVATFRVLDAPHVYIRRQLGMDENGTTTTTTAETTETAYGTNQPGVTGPQPDNTQPATSQVNPPPPSPPQISRRMTVQQQEPEPPAENSTPPPKKVGQKERRSTTTNETAPKPSATPRAVSSEKTSGDLPYGKPVPGKPGYVFSPFDKNGGYVDVTGYSPGQKVKDPYSREDLPRALGRFR